ncbi:hypothetical protein CLV46_2064 [Diaminobutyricimonas aerilata]|uniref:Uncharacterized protein n=1 Tax=Diaminobutyricimonas aerilata TaxID=1162967 RepID=A0A2M9CKU4_9MICO|nr:hypothetical protein [Diaminobutyricimonas aerilata]PJJ72492.1 hypothetical protein CLV46_2064 [Diaminobutyricimonas aerilata]
MELVLIGAVAVLAAVAIVIVVRRSAQRRGESVRDDTTRAGAESHLDSRRATRRAEGATAWTRIGGGGV